MCLNNFAVSKCFLYSMTSQHSVYMYVLMFTFIPPYLYPVQSQPCQLVHIVQHNLFINFYTSSIMTLALNTTSWNIRGISSPAKRTNILNQLHKLKSDICLLQETHLTEAESQKLKARWLVRPTIQPTTLKNVVLLV